MASLVYNSLLTDLLNGDVQFDADTFKMMLVTSSYTPVKDTHNRRDDVTNEHGATGGYSTGGNAVTATVNALNTAGDYVEVGFTVTPWTSSTITARGGVIYKSRGGASSADELVAYVDFGSDIVSTNGTFTVTISQGLRITNTL
jgi:hypothetical protein